MLTYVSIIALAIGALYGWGLYQAIMHKNQFWAVMWSVNLGLLWADRFFNSSILRGFIAGLSK